MAIQVQELGQVPVQSWYDLPPEMQEEVDYLDEDGYSEASFIVVNEGDPEKAYWVDLEEFDIIPEYGDGWSNVRAQGWEGYAAQGFYCGLLLKYIDDGEEVAIARYTC